MVNAKFWKQFIVLLFHQLITVSKQIFELFGVCSNSTGNLLINHYIREPRLCFHPVWKCREIIVHHIVVFLEQTLKFYYHPSSSSIDPVHHLINIIISID